MRVSITLFAALLLCPVASSSLQGTPAGPLAGARISVALSGAVCNVWAFGAVGNGRADDTKAIQSAIDCAATQKGLAWLPSNGTFLSFAVSVPGSASSFGLQIDGTLRFSNDTSAWSSSTQYALSLGGGSSIALVGSGTVDGQGAAWWPCAKAGCYRPGLVGASRATDLLIANLTFLNSPNHNLELYASPFEVVGVTILAPPSTGSGTLSHNTDGIDVHGNGAYIHDCTIRTGDDHIAMHSNDTLIERVFFGTGHGASIGSLGVGTFLKNITVRDSVFVNATAVARIKADSASSGCLVDVLYENITATACATTIQINTNYPSSGPGTGTLAISNIVFSAFAVEDAGAAGQIQCSSNAPCTGITLNDISHTPAPKSGWQCANAHGTATDVTPAISCLQK